ncbi:DUF5919 domain-containing protein [Kribbella shirazensis]|uniref:DUF5919 domain-containing protein n=1 Tax=Kribbella shirazensis TaxID=1105143 RepID=A0A7X5V484_9ACTN|nr:DUF5919 domain-containing protein [Kribbella shirazensis]NIK54324.1 hypothetical protein [Kribbella shirazensis]
MATETALKVLLRQRHLQEHRAFCREYDKVARSVDRELVGAHPSKATFYRWLSGSLSGLPHPGHCRILENMFPGWTAEVLFRPWSDDGHPAVEQRSASEPTGLGPLAGVTAVYPSRTEFAHEMPPAKLFDNAVELSAVGLSLNLLCQSYADVKLRELVRRAHLRLLFLDPDGESVKRRNREEGHEDGHLSAWSRGNLNLMCRIRDELADEAGNLELRMYDETLRFNLMFIDGRMCVMQTYLPALRGLDSPTFVMQPAAGGASDLYSVYWRIFSSFWERGTAL